MRLNPPSPEDVRRLAEHAKVSPREAYRTLLASSIQDAINKVPDQQISAILTAMLTLIKVSQ